MKKAALVVATLVVAALAAIALGQLALLAYNLGLPAPWDRAALVAYALTTSIGVLVLTLTSLALHLAFVVSFPFLVAWAAAVPRKPKSAATR